MFDPEMTMRGPDGAELCKGMYWRRNHKNRRCRETWWPMEPEFRALVQAWRSEAPDAGPDDLVCGNLWGIWRMLTTTSTRLGYPSMGPTGLRRSFASMLSAREYSGEFIRQALGHQGEDSVTQGGSSTRPTTASAHYMMTSPGLLAQRARRAG